MITADYTEIKERSAESDDPTLLQMFTGMLSPVEDGRQLMLAAESHNAACATRVDGDYGEIHPRRLPPLSLLQLRVKLDHQTEERAGDCAPARAAYVAAFVVLGSDSDQTLTKCHAPASAQPGVIHSMPHRCYGLGVAGRGAAWLAR